jgi:hypothetical protein
VVAKQPERIPMDKKITTYSALRNLVDVDPKDHKLKDIANLFLNAMNDWPTFNQSDISEFVEELKEYFGAPLTAEKIGLKKVNPQNAWQVEAGSSIADILLVSEKSCNQPDFDKIVENFLNYYSLQLQRD